MNMDGTSDVSTRILDLIGNLQLIFEGCYYKSVLNKKDDHDLLAISILNVKS